MQIRPKTNKLVLDFVSSSNFKNLLKDTPLHVVVPRVLDEKLMIWKERFPEIDFFPAHKATTSKSLLEIVKNHSCGIDVSSYGELENAIDIGFSPDKISCSGPKDDSYLNLAVKSGCIISIDSLDELKSLSGKKTDILVRISDPEIKGRMISMKRSRFGISKDKMGEVFDFLSKNKKIKLKGFHFHADGYDSGMRAGIIEYFLSLMLEARGKGHFPDIINLGGGIKAQIFENPASWQNYVKLLEEGIVEGCEEKTWDRKEFGLYKNDRGKISGRESAEAPALTPNPEDSIMEMLDSKTVDGVSIRELLLECNVRLILEPGFALFYDSGITAIKVISVKDISGDNLAVTDGNMFTISSRMFDSLPDPILISDGKKLKKEYFIAGNLCREDDMIMNRKVEFANEIKMGDVLVFVNTGAYRQNYENANPQMQRRPRHIVARKSKNGWKLRDEDDI